MIKSGAWKWLALAAVIVVIDQITKYVITHAFAVGESVAVTPFFNLLLVHNAGAAFSFLSDQAGWQRWLFTAIALGASAWIVHLLATHPQDRLLSLALALVLAGAVGNVIDRILFGAVIDFLDFHALGHHWPAFNVADSAITCGAALLVWDAMRSGKNAASAAGTERRQG